MKTILITMALIGFTAVGSYAQDTKTCACKKKAVHHKVATTPVVAVVKTPVTHKRHTAVVGCATTRSYTGNYPRHTVAVAQTNTGSQERESNYLKPVQVPGTDIPSTDPDYYMHDDGRCRWHCSPGLDQLDKEKK